jgi:hypothetical protein
LESGQLLCDRVRHAPDHHDSVIATLDIQKRNIGWKRGSEMETNPLERPVHLIGAKVEGFCKECRDEVYFQPIETSYLHIVTCRSCIEYLKQELATRDGFQNEASSRKFPPL